MSVIVFLFRLLRLHIGPIPFCRCINNWNTYNTYTQCGWILGGIMYRKLKWGKERSNYKGEKKSNAAFLYRLTSPSSLNADSFESFTLWTYYNNNHTNANNAKETWSGVRRTETDQKHVWNANDCWTREIWCFGRFLHKNFQMLYNLGENGETLRCITFPLYVRFFLLFGRFLSLALFNPSIALSSRVLPKIRAFFSFK